MYCQVKILDVCPELVPEFFSRVYIPTPGLTFNS